MKIEDSEKLRLALEALERIATFNFVHLKTRGVGKSFENPVIVAMKNVAIEALNKIEED